ncbi:efflux RND transporter periplasmic adaptor subunit [Endozoicomonas sp.]|uniref:efflux RND transporter periplasmic adaptor subunit n=1 Tax=Endozoicomonas sp. TaxID=1892382 RepID=UPI0028887D3B|nr:efflux RND transporter periplasmic adaptor subunit [Endozoicomonas sp.]
MKFPVLLRLAIVLMASFSSIVIASGSVILNSSNASGDKTLHLMGSLESIESIAVVSRVDGVVERYAHEVGEQTQGSQPLVHLNQEDYLLALDRTRASLAQANADLSVKKIRFERYQKLAAQNNLSREQLDGAKADFLMSKADVRLKEIDVDEAELALLRTRIKGDSGLWVSERLVNKGDWVQSGQKLYQLEQIEKLKAVVYITEDHVGRLLPGQQVELVAEAIPGHYFSGRVRSIGIKPDAKRNSYPIDIIVDNPGRVLRPGFTVDAELTLAAPGVTAHNVQAAVGESQQ